MGVVIVYVYVVLRKFVYCRWRSPVLSARFMLARARAKAAVYSNSGCCFNDSPRSYSCAVICDSRLKLPSKSLLYSHLIEKKKWEAVGFTVYRFVDLSGLRCYFKQLYYIAKCC